MDRYNRFMTIAAFVCGIGCIAVGWLPMAVFLLTATALSLFVHSRKRRRRNAS
jgi:hypothetical protein